MGRLLVGSLVPDERRGTLMAAHRGRPAFSCRACPERVRRRDSPPEQARPNGVGGAEPARNKDWEVWPPGLWMACSRSSARLAVEPACSPGPTLAPTDLPV